MGCHLANTFERKPMASKLHSAPELIRLLKEDDVTAFTEIYQRYAPTLYQQAYQILKDRDETKEVIQEVFTSLWQRRDEIWIDTNLGGYLYRAVRNQVLKIYAHKQVRIAHAHLPDDFQNQDTSSTDALIREKQLQRAIDQEIEQLPKKMRIVFNLSRKEHLSYKEIAHQLELSEGTVKTQIKLALRILRNRLQDFFYLFIFFLFFFK